MQTQISERLESVDKLRKDIKTAALTLSDHEARYLVDQYYLMQEDRKRANNQSNALFESEEPNQVIDWLAAQSTTLEKSIAAALDQYSNSKPLGEWARSVDGIGPIIAAGLLAHISFNPWRCRNPEATKTCKEKEPCSDLCGREVISTAGQIWRFAGLDPTSRWAKGEKRPWNASLKTLCWKIGESFVKVCNKPTAVYGQIYSQRKALEIERNERGDFAGQAEGILKAKNIGKSTDAYKAYSVGKLPPAHIQSRAKRYAVKLFLAHYHEVGYKITFGKEPPLPYPIAILGHAHKIEPPMKRG